MDIDTLLALLQAGQLQGLLKLAATLSAVAPLLADEETAQALRKALTLLRQAEEKGVLDKAAQLVDRAAPLLDALNEVDYKALADALHAADTGDGAGLLDLLKATRDPEFRRGLARLIALIRALGSVTGDDE